MHYSNSAKDTLSIEVVTIDWLALRKEGSISNGAAVGFLIPFIMIIPNDGFEDYGYAIVLVHGPSAIIGGLIGSNKHRIDVDGQLSKYWAGCTQLNEKFKRN